MFLYNQKTNQKIYIKIYFCQFGEMLFKHPPSVAVQKMVSKRFFVLLELGFLRLIRIKFSTPQKTNSCRDEAMLRLYMSSNILQFFVFQPQTI